MLTNSEESNGISEFIDDNEGIFGIIKQRFSDFVVNEVTSSGEIVCLTSEVVPPIPSVVISNENLEQPSEINDEDIELLRVLSGQKHLKEIKPSTFLVKSKSGKDFTIEGGASEKMTEHKIKVHDLTKERRTVLHQFIRSEFPNLNSSTSDVGGVKFICVTKKGSSHTKDRRNSWPKSQSHVNFVLYKENIDTMEAINVLASKLRLRPGMFTYAGTKDKRAKTSQLVSVYQVSPKNISSAAKCISKIKVGNFFFCHKSQKLGSSKGNHFKIVLREVAAPAKNVEVCVEALKKDGFINYFGTQRFGTSEVGTHAIGRALLQSNWKEAVDLILTKRENDFPNMAEAKKIWAESRDATSAFQSLAKNRKGSIEGHLLSGLMVRGTADLVNALEKIPRNVKLMYIHAYQSYLWNHVVSKRIKKYNLKVLPGDLVRKKSGDHSPIVSPELEEDHSKMECEDDQPCPSSVRFVEEEQLNDVNILEVVLPLPGYNVVYPNNEIKEWYGEYLEADGLSFDGFRNKVKTFSLGGTYRTVVVRPQSVEYVSCCYDDPTKPLVHSDMDVLNDVDVMQNRLADGTHQALILEFTLPTSAYATMALRQLLKMETSSKFHSTLNSGSGAQKRPCEDEGFVRKGMKLTA